jgi:hypothetical protein
VLVYYYLALHWLHTRARCYKTFYGRNLRTFKINWCSFLASLSSLVQCLLVKQEPTQLKHLLGALLQGRLLALPSNNRLGWKGLPVTNTLAFYENSKITAIKRLITLGPGDCAIKHYRFVMYGSCVSWCVCLSEWKWLTIAKTLAYSIMFSYYEYVTF